MSQETVAFVVDRLLSDRDFRLQFAVVPLETLLGVQCEGFDLTDDETVSLVQADIRMWCWPGRETGADDGPGRAGRGPTTPSSLTVCWRRPRGSVGISRLKSQCPRPTPRTPLPRLK